MLNRFRLPAAAVMASGLLFGGLAYGQQSGQVGGPDQQHGQRDRQGQMGRTGNDAEAQSPLFTKFVLEKIQLGIKNDLALGKVIEQKATSPELKKIGQTFVSDWQDVDKRVRSVAASKHIKFDEGTMPAGLPREEAGGTTTGKTGTSGNIGESGDVEKILALMRQVDQKMQQEMTQHLDKLQGEHFDRMVSQHLKMCNAFATTFVTQARQDIDPQVRPVLDEILTKLQSHKTQIDQVCQTLGKGEGARAPGENQHQNQNQDKYRK
jgi:predicted outer membrane protein